MAGDDLLPRGLQDDIRAAIVESQPEWSRLVGINRERLDDEDSPSLAVKYVRSKYAATYSNPNPGIFIGSNDYTWGRGVYVTGVEEPLSTGIYGRIGVVAQFNQAANWRAFDARDDAKQRLYLEWLHAQPDYAEAVLTVHADHWLHQFRNQFRAQFRIDVVLFRPDECDLNGWYTKPDDTWFAVADFKSDGTLQEGYSQHFHNARATILVEEEFETDDPALTRSPLIRISGLAPNIPNLPTVVRQAYFAQEIHRVPS